MAKTLIICEKPCVAHDVATALLGSMRQEGRRPLRGSGRDVVGFAVGHLVEQVDPDAYDARYKKWRYEDLPILPDELPLPGPRRPGRQAR